MKINGDTTVKGMKEIIQHWHVESTLMVKQVVAGKEVRIQ